MLLLLTFLSEMFKCTSFVHGLVLFVLQSLSNQKCHQQNSATQQSQCEGLNNTVSHSNNNMCVKSLGCVSTSKPVETNSQCQTADRTGQQRPSITKAPKNKDFLLLLTIFTFT